MDYPRPRHWRQFEQALGVPITSRRAGRSVSSFRPHCFELPADRTPSQKTIITFSDLRRIVAARPPRTVAGAVRQSLIFDLEEPCCDIESVARLLHRSNRSIQRDLQLEGVSFRQILAEARRAEAERLIRGPEDSFGGIAWRLGYSERSISLMLSDNGSA